MADRGRTHGPAVLSAADFQALYDRMCRGTRREKQDRHGALNNISPAQVVDAARSVSKGMTVSLASQVEHQPAADNPDPCVHQLSLPKGGPESDGLDFAMDSLSLHVHGDADSHLDALCHVAYDGTFYNGVPADEAGAAELSVDLMGRGVVGRGVLLDIPRVRKKRWLQPGDHVTTTDLTAAEASQGVHVGKGDLLFVRVGHRRRRRELGPWDAASARAGLHPTAIEFLADRRVAVLGSDGNNDTAPSAAEGVGFPVHVLAIRALGMPLLDYLELGNLAEACQAAGRWDFFCVIAPLRLSTGTGSPVNPIAVF